MQSDALDQPLSFSQRAGLRVHLWLCKWCRRYGRQIEFLRTAARADGHDHIHAHAPEKTLPSEARERIKQALKSSRTSPD